MSVDILGTSFVLGFWNSSLRANNCQVLLLLLCFVFVIFFFFFFCKLSHCFLFVCLFCCCCFYYRIHTKVLWIHINMNLKQNEAQSARAESTHKGVNQRSKDVTQTQQQRPESPMVTVTWHACKYKVHKLHQCLLVFFCFFFFSSSSSFSFRVTVSGQGQGQSLPSRTCTLLLFRLATGHIHMGSTAIMTVTRTALIDYSCLVENKREGERENSNSKILCDKDCSSGSIKTCLITSPC